MPYSVSPSLPRQLYHLLRDRQGDYLELDQLGQALGQPTGAIQQGVLSLQAERLAIEYHPTLGCRLLRLPEALVAHELTYHLATRYLGQQVWVHQEVDSTNDEARLLADQGTPEGALVVAESQRAGRGRRGRSWYSPAGVGLWYSLLFHPPGQLTSGVLPLLLGVAIAFTLRRGCNVQACLKWPNDILIAHRKVAGVLCERYAPAGQDPVLIAGTGINVHQETFPVSLQSSATSIYQETREKPNRCLLLKQLLQETENLYLEAVESGTSRILDQAKELSATLGQDILWKVGLHQVRGRACDLLPDGALLVETESGCRQTISAGDICHLGPGPAG